MPMTLQDRSIARSRASFIVLDRYASADRRDAKVMIDLATLIPSPGAKHRCYAGWAFECDEYRDAFGCEAAS